MKKDITELFMYVDYFCTQYEHHIKELCSGGVFSKMHPTSTKKWLELFVSKGSLFQKRHYN